MTFPRRTVTIDDQSEPGSWARAIRHGHPEYAGAVAGAVKEGLGSERGSEVRTGAGIPSAIPDLGKPDPATATTKGS